MYLLLQKVTSPRFTILNGLRPGQSVKYNDLCVLDTATMTWQARAVRGRGRLAEGRARAGGWWVPDSPYGACLCPAGLSVRPRLGLCSLSPP